MRHWSRNDRFAFFGVLLAAIGVVGAVFPQEIRHMIGLDGGTTPAPPAAAVGTTSPAPLTPAPAPPPVSVLKVTVVGDSDTITILAAKTADEETESPVSVTGDSQENTYYLGKGRHAIVNVTGDGNTLLLAPEVKSRVQTSVMGDSNHIRDAGDE